MAAVWAAGPEPMTIRTRVSPIPRYSLKIDGDKGAMIDKKERRNIPTTLLCIFLAPCSTAGVFEGFLVKAVAAAAIDSPALERSVRLKVEANRLGGFV